MQDPIADRLGKQAAAGEFSGASTRVWKHGRVVHRAAVGRRDGPAAAATVELDTIFRIASLTKPVTAVAALSLLEEERFALDDPITGVVPELSGLQVLRDPAGAIDDAVPAERPISFRDLLTHRSGLSYGDLHRGPIGGAYRERLGPTIDNPLSPDEWIARLATLPLIDQPGAAFHYGHSSDLLGFVVARLEQVSLGEVLARRVFAPLGMRDTGFAVPAAKRDRRAPLSGFDAQGAPATLVHVPGGEALAERPETMTFESGGQGLWSTADDYLAFARLFVGRGAVDGVRVLRPETVTLMTTNQLTAAQRASARLFGRALFARGHGYGMGLAVVLEPDHADPLRCRGGVGTVGWPGAYGSWWQADPTNGCAMVFLAHHMVGLDQLAAGIGLGIWSAIATFHALAASEAGSAL